MIRSKQLIAENNKKRKLLTKENEKYYDDMLIYIRLNWKASEQQSEEILMELLDHLIEGQHDGKTAADIFGDDPKGYADELLGELPRETWKMRLLFFSYLIVNLISIFVGVRGIVLLIVGFFRPVDTSIFIFKSTLVTLYWLLAIALLIWFILHIIEKSIFKQNSSNWKNALKAGLAGSLVTGSGFVMTFLVPNFGPSFAFGWLPSLASGVILWLINFWAKKQFNIL
ncbi:DUF1129 family protein [Sporolactobacillus shoreicorticis]|uniref:DUF1129 family protein n=1 Tax=Sporolactobacillus shoreicorticis TaxID=1923877 RepID=A0ABW5S367_9BACL|nr:DUF1129 family protein [Sporolactobacillus shoreicorticis]MCO7127100.1 DUF1129 family protein [Sporolactobacillus shoreicorticis]